MVIVGFGKFLVLELKVGRGKATGDQLAWLSAMREAGVDARLYRDVDWVSRGLVDELVAAKRKFATG